MADRFLARFANTPSLMAVDQGDRFNACLNGLAQDAQAQELIAGRGLSGEGAPEMTDDFWFSPDDWRANFRPYKVVAGILQIPVKGVLLHDFPWTFASWATGYTYIWKAFERGMADAEVKGIAFMIDSPGGEVAGNFDLVDKMWAAKSEDQAKPVWAFADEHAFSAAYSIASVADVISMSRTGGVGSVGVVTTHVDQSKLLQDWGLKITFIFAGKHKVDGNSMEPLPKAVQARIQSRIDELYGIFTETVARNRAMSVQSVRDTEALTYGAKDAIAVGFADRIGSLEDSFQAFSNEINGVPDNDGDPAMSTKTPETAASAEAAITAEQLAAAKAEAFNAGKTEGTAEGRKAERERISTIVGSEVAKTRVATAIKMALSTDMTPEQAAAVLETLPEATASKGKEGASFDDAMGRGNPEVGATDDANASKDPEDIARDRILAAQGKTRKQAAA